MADNVQLNPGSGGARLATFRDANGNDWPSSVVVFATSTTSGAAVLQAVDTTHGLPVSIVSDGALEAEITAGTALIGKTASGFDGSVLYEGTDALEIKNAAFDVSTLGDNEIVAAVSGKRIRVLQWGLAAGGDVDVKWKSGSSTSISGTRPLTKYASAGGSPSPWGRFKTGVGEALNLNLTAAVPVGGELAYVEVSD